MFNAQTTPLAVSGDGRAAPISVPELRQLVSDAAPSALLVPPWLMRRIIKADRGIGGMLLEVPHRRSYTISRDALLAVTTLQELGLDAAARLPEKLLLLSCLPDRLAYQPRGASLLYFWRLLFHATLDAAEIKVPANLLSAALMEEVKNVLRSDGWLLPPLCDESCLTEFAAVYLELRFFHPALLACTFPGLAGNRAVDAALCQLADAEAVFSRTRLAGAPSPDNGCVESPADVGPETTATTDGPGRALLVTLADVARQRGNLVRSAILRTKAANAAGPDAGRDIDALCARLQKPLSLGDDAVRAWRRELPKLLPHASTGLWPPAARLLFDVQKVCTDCERETFTVDLVEWVCSLGRKAIVRPLPLRTDVLLYKHLKSAQARLGKIAGDHAALEQLFEQALHHAEKRLRDRIRPLLAATFKEVGFVPVNVPETLAQENIIEELLDRICERGFINMGDVRDAISRNQLKIPDASPLQVLLGDQLLRSNRRLAVRLDGVYHRGEIYLRWLQRLSSMLFGNWLGRWLVLYIILPFGGAVAAGVFLQEIVHLAGIRVHVSGIHREPIVDQPLVQSVISYILQAISDERQKGSRWERDADGHEAFRIKPLEAFSALLIAGVYLLLLLHLASVRTGTVRFLSLIWTILRGIFYDVPLWLVELPRVRAFLDWAPVCCFRRWVLRPMLASVIGLLLWMPFGFPGLWDDLEIAGSLFVLTLIVFNTPLARRLEEAFADWFSRNWHSLLFLAASIVTWVIDLSKLALDRIERLIYVVDEWLRFREGDSRFSLAWKLVLSLAWFAATYLIRIVIHLFFEPTVNPVKHFPAVTVGAKLIIPIIPALLAAMTTSLQPFLGLALAGTIAGIAVALLPGIFGFAVWEFKENWKLYQANRPKNLKAAAIGHHGETVARLLRPGFHSGTVPKAYGKLRHALQAGSMRKVHRQRDNLHHVSEALAHFAERELLALLKLSRNGRGLDIEVGDIILATNRIRLELLCEAGEPMVLSFVESSGRLEGAMEEPGWLTKVPGEQAAVFRTALAGWYRLAGVDGLRQEPCPAIAWQAWVAAWERDRQGAAPALA